MQHAEHQPLQKTPLGTYSRKGTSTLSRIRMPADFQKSGSIAPEGDPIDQCSRGIISCNATTYRQGGRAAVVKFILRSDAAWTPGHHGARTQTTLARNMREHTCKVALKEVTAVRESMPHR
jgi:hypothetical protein